ncbi:hypothetical protein [Promicromonospora sp. MEB111]|uniref:hypothetical protein n=1 Tax=Promicromonospora sp. MEB111 TaxID=3040301 RepID=UPI00254F168C|nr:hypothetical protein [Promicromonospora sp. MEB111]
MSGVGVQDWTWTIEAPAGWLVVPSTVTEPAETVGAWQGEAVELLLTSFLPQDSDGGAQPDAGHVELVRDSLTQTVASLVAFADEAATEGARAIAGLGLLDRGPVPVLVTVGMMDPAESDDALMTVLGATGGNPVNPPSIEYPELPDGDGIQVTRVDIDEAGGAWVTVAVGRRTEHPEAVVDTALIWRSQDLVLVPTILETLVGLLSAVKIIRSEP